MHVLVESPSLLAGAPCQASCWVRVSTASKVRVRTLRSIEQGHDTLTVVYRRIFFGLVFVNCLVLPLPVCAGGSSHGRLPRAFPGPAGRLF